MEPIHAVVALDLADSMSRVGCVSIQFFLYFGRGHRVSLGGLSTLIARRRVALLIFSRISARADGRAKYLHFTSPRCSWIFSKSRGLATVSLPARRVTMCENPYARGIRYLLVVAGNWKLVFVCKPLP